MAAQYTTPRLTPKGDVTEITRAVVEGTGDPADPRNLQAMSVGGVGFNL